MKNRVFFKGNEGRAELHSMEIAATEPPTPPDPEGGAASSADSPGHESRCLGTFQRFAAQFGEDIPQSDMTYYAPRCCAENPFEHPEFVADILVWIYDLDAASFRGAVQSFRGALTYDNLNQLRRLEGRDGPEGHNAKIVHFLKSGGVLGYQVLCGAILAMNPMLHRHRHDAMVRLLNTQENTVSRSSGGSGITAEPEAPRPARPAVQSDTAAENVQGRRSSRRQSRQGYVLALLDKKLKNPRHTVQLSPYQRFIQSLLKDAGYNDIRFGDMESQESSISVGDEEDKDQILIFLIINGPPDELMKKRLLMELEGITGSAGDADIVFTTEYGSTAVILTLGRLQADLLDRLLFLYPGILAGFGILEVIRLASFEIVDLRDTSQEPLATCGDSSKEMQEKQAFFAHAVNPFATKFEHQQLTEKLTELQFQSALMTMTAANIDDDEYLSAICDLIQMESSEEKVPSFLEEPNSKRRAPTPTLTEATHTESSGKSSASTIDTPHFLDTSLGYDFR
eukprot:scpid78903/ scgid0059/ 